MTEKQLKEWAEFMGITIDEAIELRKRGEKARNKENRFEAQKGEGRFEKDAVKKTPR